MFLLSTFTSCTSPHWSNLGTTNWTGTTQERRKNISQFPRPNTVSPSASPQTSHPSTGFRGDCEWCLTRPQDCQMVDFVCHIYIYIYMYIYIYIGGSCQMMCQPRSVNDDFIWFLSENAKTLPRYGSNFDQDGVLSYHDIMTGIRFWPTPTSAHRPLAVRLCRLCRSRLGPWGSP